MSLDVRALLCLALFITFQLFATCGALHNRIHPDSADPQHSCALTLWTQGQVSLGDGMIALVVFVALLLFSLPPLPTPVFSSIDCRLRFSRGPPRF